MELKVVPSTPIGEIVEALLDEIRTKQLNHAHYEIRVSTDHGKAILIEIYMVVLEEKDAPVTVTFKVDVGSAAH